MRNCARCERTGGGRRGSASGAAGGRGGRASNAARVSRGRRTRGIARVHAGVLLFAKRSGRNAPGRTAARKAREATRRAGRDSRGGAREGEARKDGARTCVERGGASRDDVRARAPRGDGSPAFFSRPLFASEGDAVKNARARGKSSASSPARRGERIARDARETLRGDAARFRGRVTRARARAGREISRCRSFSSRERFAGEANTGDGAARARRPSPPLAPRGKRAGSVPHETNPRCVRGVSTSPARARRRRSMESEPRGSAKRVAKRASSSRSCLVKREVPLFSTSSASRMGI